MTRIRRPDADVAVTIIYGNPRVYDAIGHRFNLERNDTIPFVFTTYNSSINIISSL